MTSLVFFDDKFLTQKNLKMVKAMKSRNIESEKNKHYYKFYIFKIIILQINEIYDYATKNVYDFISIKYSNFLIDIRYTFGLFRFGSYIVKRK